MFLWHEMSSFHRNVKFWCDFVPILIFFTLVFSCLNLSQKVISRHLIKKNLKREYSGMNTDEHESCRVISLHLLLRAIKMLLDIKSLICILSYEGIFLWCKPSIHLHWADYMQSPIHNPGLFNSQETQDNIHWYF